MDPISYKDSGVDISEQDRFIEAIRKINPDIGSFSGVFPIPVQDYRQPQLVASTDGVGTKLLIAEMLDKYDTIGIDCVAMVANDLICCGARPLFFLDYYGVGKLDAKRASDVMKGLVEGCRQANCQLIGGETAEMPGVYSGKHFDLVGFIVGIVDKDEVIDGSGIQPGDVIIGFPSSGIHSNGLSLARKVLFGKAGLEVNSTLDELTASVGETLLTPTRIYVNAVSALMRKVNVKGIAHITGGGLRDNVPRILPENCQAEMHSNRWQIPEVFRLIQEKGPVERDEMFHAFNMGIGMVAVVAENDVEQSLHLAEEHGAQAILIGIVKKGKRQAVIF